MVKQLDLAEVQSKGDGVFSWRITMEVEALDGLTLQDAMAKEGRNNRQSEGLLNRERGMRHT